MREFVKSVFSDSTGDGKTIGSFSRCISFIIVLCVMGWDSYFLKTTHNLPDPLTLGAQGVFMVVFYGANRVTDAAKQISNS